MSDALQLKGDSSFRITREIAPKSHRVWQTQNEDVLSSLQSHFKAWLDDITQSESLFKQNVYDNPDLSDMDLRQHRIMLYDILHSGEELSFLYLDFGYRFGKIQEVKPFIEIIDGKLKEFFKVLFAWHGSIDNQQDLPDSLKQAFKESDEDKLVDFEFPSDGEGRK